MSKPGLFYLEKILSSLSRNDPAGLRETANAAISAAALENNSTKAKLAVIAYALTKLLQKEHFQKEPGWKAFKTQVGKKILNAILAAKKEDTSQMSQILISISDRISMVDREFGNYYENLVEKARVKQASTAYAYGLSLGQAAALTGCNQKELFNYIGYTKMHEETPVLGSIEDRVKRLQEILKPGSA